MTVSAERLVTEIQKVFVSPNPVPALEMFSHIPGLPYDVDYFPLFQKYANGDMNFLWAGYLYNYGTKDEVEEFLSQMRLPIARRLNIQFYLSFKSPMNRVSFVFMDDVESYLRFEFVLRLVAARAYRKKFGPYMSAIEKVKKMGFGGDFWKDNSVEGPRIGKAISLMEDFALSNPTAVEPHFKEYANQLLDEVF